MNIYVGNLSFDVSEENLKETFQAFGEVISVSIVKDRYSGMPRGFGFVEMSNRDEAKAAIENLNGKEFLGRKVNVSEARPRTDRRGSGRQGESKGRFGHSGRNRY